MKMKRNPKITEDMNFFYNELKKIYNNENEQVVFSILRPPGEAENYEDVMGMYIEDGDFLTEEKCQEEIGFDIFRGEDHIFTLPSPHNENIKEMDLRKYPDPVYYLYKKLILI